MKDNSCTFFLLLTVSTYIHKYINITLIEHSHIHTNTHCSGKKNMWEQDRTKVIEKLQSANHKQSYQVSSKYYIWQYNFIPNRHRLRRLKLKRW